MHQHSKQIICFVAAMALLIACEGRRADIGSDSQPAVGPYAQAKRIRTRQAAPLWTLDEQRATLVEIRSVGSNDPNAPQTYLGAYGEITLADGARHYLVGDTRVELINSSLVEEVAWDSEAPAPLLFVTEESKNCPDYAFGDTRPALLHPAHHRSRDVVFRGSNLALAWDANQFVLISDYCLDPLSEIGPDSPDAESVHLKNRIQAKQAFLQADPCDQQQCHYVPYNNREPIQFGWDYETQLVQPITGNRILNLYRPIDTNANEWLRMSMESRFDLLSAELHRVGMIRRSYAERREVGPKDTTFVKITQEELDETLRATATLAPDFFSNVLQAEDIATWEVEANRPVHSVAELIKDVQAIVDLGLYLNSNVSGFHLHVSFPTYGYRSDGKKIPVPGPIAEQYAGFWMYLNELAMFIYYGSAAVQSAETALQEHARHWFRPVTHDEYTAAVKYLKYPRKAAREYDDRFVGFRALAKYSSGGDRFGLELRYGFVYDDSTIVDTQISLVNGLILPTLVQPDKLVEGSRLGVTFGWADYAKSRFLNRQDLGKLTQPTKAAIRKAWESIDPLYQAENLDLVWAIPMADWHTRPPLASLGTALLSKRENYRNRLDSIAQGFENKDGRALALEFSKALSTWLQATTLDYYLF